MLMNNTEWLDWIDSLGVVDSVSSPVHESDNWDAACYMCAHVKKKQKNLGATEKTWYPGKMMFKFNQR